jgi:hypothetical protein
MSKPGLACSQPYTLLQIQFFLLPPYVPKHEDTSPIKSYPFEIEIDFDTPLILILL